MDLVDRKHVLDVYAMYIGLTNHILIRTGYHEYQSTPNEQAGVWSWLDRWRDFHQSIEDSSYIHNGISSRMITMLAQLENVHIDDGVPSIGKS